MRKGPILAAVALVVAVAIAGGVYYVYSNLDALVKAAIEKYGSEVVGTQVRVGTVRIALTEGRGTIAGLRVANPRGFSSDDAFALGEIAIQIDATSVTSTPIVVPEVTVIAPQVAVELDAKGKSNIQAILDHVNSGSGSAPPAAEGGDGAPVRIAIGRFVFEKGRIDADLQAVGGEEMAADLPPVRLQRIGGSRGATPEEIGQEVTRALLGSVAKVVARIGAERLIDEKLEGETGEAAKEILRRFLD